MFLGGDTFVSEATQKPACGNKTWRKFNCCLVDKMLIEHQNTVMKEIFFSVF